MDKLGSIFLIFLFFCLYLSLIYIPLNQLTVHRSSSRLDRIPILNPYDFSFVYLQTLQSFSPSTSPFIFIHGHKGSVKQAISMTRFFENAGVSIAMYSIDFNEAAVGVSLGILKAEAEFTEECIKAVIKRHPTKEIVILAHSFGGIIASLSMANMGSSHVKGMIALSTPFEASPINSDYRFIKEYSKIRKFWNNSELFVVSITGGIRDLTVPPQLTNVKELGAKHSLHAYSTEIAGLHTEIDHVAMVWGYEFFEKLAKVVKIADSFKGAKVIREVKKLFQSELSKMVKQVHEDHKVIITASVEPVSLERPSLKFNEFQYQLFTSEHLETLEKNTEIKHLQVINLDEIHEFSMFQAFIGYDIKVKFKENLGTFIKTGKDFKVPRLPLRVRVLGEGQIQAMYAKCGHEEIIKYNENDFILYFHETCENGPEIWLFGYDIEYEYTVNVKIDLLSVLVCMIRDFRIHIFTFASFVCLSYMTPYPNTVQAIGFGLSYFFGKYARDFSVFEWENPHDLGINYTVLDMIFIYMGARGICTLVFWIFEVLLFANRKLTKIRYFSFALLPFGYNYPWPVFSFLTLVLGKEKNITFILFVSHLLMLPQHVGWYIALFSHNIHEYDYEMFPSLILLLSQFFFGSVSPQVECIFASLLIALSSHEFLYRSLMIYQSLCIWLSIKCVISFFLSSLFRLSNEESKNLEEKPEDSADALENN